MNRIRTFRAMAAIAFILAVSFGVYAQTGQLSTKASTAVEKKDTIRIIKPVTVKENPALDAARKAMKSVQTVGPTTPPPKALPDAVYDKNIRGVLYLGKGYDVMTGGFCDADNVSMKERYILDVEKLLKDGQIGRIWVDKSSSDYFASDEITTYSQARATKVGVSGSYACFKAGVEASFSNSMYSEYGRTYSTLVYRSPMYKLYINPDVDLSQYMADGFYKDAKAVADVPNITKDQAIQKYSTFFPKYGTHVVRSVIIGGRLEHNVTSTYQYNLTESSSRVSVEASFNALVASANINVETSGSQSSSEYKKYTQSKTLGTPAFYPTINEQNVRDWYNRMLREPGLCDFESNSLERLVKILNAAKLFPNVGAWALYSPFVTAESNYYKKFGYEKPGDYPTVECITGLALYKTASSKVNSAGDPLNVGGNSWKKINYIGGVLSSYYESDINYVLYTRKEKSSASRPPIVEIYLTDAGIDKENAYDIFKAKYGNDPSAKLYTVPILGENPKQLTSSASSPPYPGTVYGVNFNDVGNGRGARIFLNYVTSTNLGPNKKPIMQVRFNKRDVSPQYWIPNNLTGTFFTVMSSKNKEQDSAKGYGSYTDNSRKYPKVYGENYLQYSYE